MMQYRYFQLFNRCDSFCNFIVSSRQIKACSCLGNFGPVSKRDRNIAVGELENYHLGNGGL